MADKTAEVEATEAAAEKAKELNVDLTSVEGTGKDGKVTVTDVKETAAMLDAQETEAGMTAANPPVPESAPVLDPPEQDAAQITEQLGYHPDTVADHIEGITHEFKSSIQVWPLPLEWLVDSIKAGHALPHDDYRPKDEPVEDES
jgi:pyruvate/2-oxoglutarate dehydrogenase complex dihydrolipoamide acyltransferase (E2) component